MSLQKRYVLYINTKYPPEQYVFDAINALPEGERLGVLRLLLMLGHNALNKSQEPTAEGHS